jgi:hypothetical protein
MTEKINRANIITCTGVRNPPKSVTELLEILAKHTPAFAKLIRKELDNTAINAIAVKKQAKSYPHTKE